MFKNCLIILKQRLIETLESSIATWQLNIAILCERNMITVITMTLERCVTIESEISDSVCAHRKNSWSFYLKYSN